MKINSLIKVASGVGILLVLSGCASLFEDRRILEVEAILKEQAKKQIDLPRPDGVQPLSEDDISQMLASPVSLNDTERLSVWANPKVTAILADIGIAEADYAQAGRMENPGFTYERFSADDNVRSVLFDIGGVLLMPLKRKMEKRRLERTQYRAAGDILSHLSNTRNAWFNAVAQKQQTGLLLRALESAETGNQLTRQMSALGHSSVLESAESELFLSELRTTLTQQRLAESEAKEALIKQLGLWGKQAHDLTIPDRLPELPDAPIEIDAVEQEAIANRLDVKMARLNIEAMGKNLRLTQLNPFLSSIELGQVNEKVEGEVEKGYEIEFRIPLFDIGDVQNYKAKRVYEQSVAQAKTTAIQAASAARLAMQRYQSAYDVADQYRTHMLPIRERISKEQMLLYNGMLISVFDLLNDLRSVIEMESNYVNAIRDFWVADTGLQATLTGADAMDMNFQGSAMKLASGGDGEAH